MLLANMSYFCHAHINNYERWDLKDTSFLFSFRSGSVSITFTNLVPEEIRSRNKYHYFSWKFQNPHNFWLIFWPLISHLPKYLFRNETLRDWWLYTWYCGLFHILGFIVYRKYTHVLNGNHIVVTPNIVIIAHIRKSRVDVKQEHFKHPHPRSLIM